MKRWIDTQPKAALVAGVLFAPVWITYGLLQYLPDVWRAYLEALYELRTRIEKSTHDDLYETDL
jgi:hypothetical protein